MQLYIGNKNYSSWSMRPWVLMKQAGIPFAETRDYVKKVLSNGSYYAALLGGQPASLNARLGRGIGPADANALVANKDLP